MRFNSKKPKKHIVNELLGVERSHERTFFSSGRICVLFLMLLHANDEFDRNYKRCSARSLDTCLANLVIRVTGQSQSPDSSSFWIFVEVSTAIREIPFRENALQFSLKLPTSIKMLLSLRFFHLYRIQSKKL